MRDVELFERTFGLGSLRAISEDAHTAKKVRMRTAVCILLNSPKTFELAQWSNIADSDSADWPSYIPPKTPPLSRGRQFSTENGPNEEI